MPQKRNKERWKKDIKNSAKSLHKKIVQVSSLYGQNPVVPDEAEVTQAFILCLIDISKYCEDNSINAKNIDTVKLMAFSIPYLLTIRNHGLSLDMYAHACLLVITGNSSTPDYQEFTNTTQVMRHLCLKYPSQHLIVYGYFKGYQESLEINS